MATQPKMYKKRREDAIGNCSNCGSNCGSKKLKKRLRAAATCSNCGSSCGGSKKSSSTSWINDLRELIPTRDETMSTVNHMLSAVEASIESMESINEHANLNAAMNAARVFDTVFSDLFGGGDTNANERERAHDRRQEPQQPLDPIFDQGGAGGSVIYIRAIPVDVPQEQLVPAVIITPIDNIDSVDNQATSTTQEPTSVAPTPAEIISQHQGQPLVTA